MWNRKYSKLFYVDAKRKDFFPIKATAITTKKLKKQIFYKSRTKTGLATIFYVQEITSMPFEWSNLFIICNWFHLSVPKSWKSLAKRWHPCNKYEDAHFTRPHMLIVQTKNNTTTLMLLITKYDLKDIFFCQWNLFYLNLQTA